MRQSALTPSQFVEHVSCPSCGSSDGAALYDDGHTFCYVCQTATQPEEKPDTEANETKSKPVSNQNETKQKALLQGSPKALPARGLTLASCEKFDYSIGSYRGEDVQIATYRDADGNPVAQKLRTKDKRFLWLGDPKKVTLYGSHLWNDGKYLTILEGEIDAISASQLQNHAFATVSLPNGAQSAVRAIKDNWDYVNRFHKVVLMFDSDQAGLEAAKAAAEILPPGKALIAKLPHKDANECLLKGDGPKLIKAIFQAQEHRPDGIKSATDFRDVIAVDETASSITWPYSKLDSVLLGMRKQELICLAAGSGTGKTTFTKEVVYHLLQHHQKVGLISLEEAPKRTLLGLVGIHLNKNLLVDRGQATEKEVTDAFDDLFTDRTCVLYDSFGTNEISVICQRIEYMAAALDVDWVILDHVSILVSGAEGDERRMLDAAATSFRTLVQRLNIGMIMVSHLTRPGGRGHEAGAAVELSQLRGSHALAQLSDSCIGIQKDPDDPDSDVRQLRVLKNRYCGALGDAGTLIYDRDSGRLLEQSPYDFADESEE